MKLLFVVLLAFSYCTFLQEVNKIHLLRKDGNNNLKNLSSHGSGVTDIQEKAALALFNSATKIYGDDLVSISKFVQSGLEKSFPANWNVEIFGLDPSWGRATHIKDDQWILAIGYGISRLDIIIWVAE